MNRAIAAALITTSALAHADNIALYVPGSYTSAARYKQFPDAGRQRIVEGVIGGFMAAPLIAGSQNTQAQAIHDCVEKMKIGAKDATVLTDEYVSGNPATAEQDIGPIVYYALKARCASGGITLR
jgi:hypothetical protein